MAAISYRVIRSARRTVVIQIMANGTVLVRSPQRMSDAQLRAFVDSRSAWIEKQLSCQPQALSALSVEELHRLTDRASEVIKSRVDYFAPKVGVTYGRITIRHQRTRWGSCSAKGNLNFNCLLLLAPTQVLDYVVVHELCHRRELNHSAAFWAEVERVLPDYAPCRRWLKENGSSLIARLPE